MDSKKKNIILIVVISIIVLALVICGIYFITVQMTRNNINNNSEDIYNKNLYVSATLPSIKGTNNTMRDEFGKRSNVSEDLKVNKQWMNLEFNDFEVYSLNSTTSVINFKIVNNNYMYIESNKFQLQIKDDSGEIVSIVDFDEVTIPSSGVINVTVDVRGDITNLKDILVDEIDYKMELQEVE